MHHAISESRQNNPLCVKIALQRRQNIKRNQTAGGRKHNSRTATLTSSDEGERTAPHRGSTKQETSHRPMPYIENKTRCQYANVLEYRSQARTKTGQLPVHGVGGCRDSQASITHPRVADVPASTRMTLQPDTINTGVPFFAARALEQRTRWQPRAFLSSSVPEKAIRPPHHRA